MTDCPLSGRELRVLPKGSGCTDYKDVPARSSYWRDETDSVTRCDKFDTSGRGGGGSDDDGDGGEQVPDRVEAWNRVSAEKADETVDPVWNVVYAWHYDGGRPRDHDGEAWVLVTDKGEDEDRSYGRYGLHIEGEDMRTRSAGQSHDELDEAVASAVGFMEENDPRTPAPDFDVTIPNAILRPLSATANRLGVGSRVEVTDAQKGEGGFRTLRVEGGGGMSMYAVQIPTKQVDGGLGDDGVMSVSLGGMYEVCRDAKKSANVRVWTDDGRLRVSSEGSKRSERYRRAMESSTPEPPKGGPADALVTTTGRNYRTAVKAMKTLPLRDSDPVAVHVGNGARMIAEIDRGTGGRERVRVPLNFKDDDPYSVEGNATIGVQYGVLQASSKSVQRPASTPVTMYLYEEGEGTHAHMALEYHDESCRWTHYLNGQGDVDEYDLSQIEAMRELTRCFDGPEDGVLSEPLSAGDAAPDVEGMALESGDSVVWTFPNSKGCRCGQQALELDRLASAHETDVYGIAASPPEELEAMSARLGLEAVQFVSDPEGEVAAEFGVEIADGLLPRRLFFVRDGQITDVTDGMGVEVEQPDGCPFDLLERSEGALTLAQNGESVLFNQISHPSVYVITGKRGSGKSAAAMRIADKVSERDDITAVTVGTPQHIRENFPGSWVHVESLSDAPPDSIVVIDESYMKYNARTPLADDNKSLGPLVNTSRHCQQSILFVTQNSALLDKNAVGESDGLLIKEPGALHSRFERRPIRELTEEAEHAFGQLPASLDNRRFGYLYTDDYQGLVENAKPGWYDDTVSRSYAASCEL